MLPEVYSNYSWCPILSGTNYSVTFYEDDILPFFSESPDIFLLHKNISGVDQVPVRILQL
jgi:hypothetical protein